MSDRYKKIANGCYAISRSAEELKELANTREVILKQKEATADLQQVQGLVKELNAANARIAELEGNQINGFCKSCDSCKEEVRDPYIDDGDTDMFSTIYSMFYCEMHHDTSGNDKYISNINEGYCSDFESKSEETNEQTA